MQTYTDLTKLNDAVTRACKRALKVNLRTLPAQDLLCQYTHFDSCRLPHQYAIVVAALYALEHADWNNVTIDSIPLSNVIHALRYTIHFRYIIGRTHGMGSSFISPTYRISCKTKANELTLCYQYPRDFRTGSCVLARCVDTQARLRNALSMYEVMWNHSPSKYKFNLSNVNKYVGHKEALKQVNMRLFLVFLACRKDANTCAYRVALINDLAMAIYAFL